MRGLIIGIQGFEDSELFVPRDLLIRAGIIIDIACFNKELDIKTKCGVKIKGDIFINDVKENTYDFIMIPGGNINLIKKDNKEKLDIVLNLLNDFNKQNKLISAICASPYILYLANLLEENKFTCYPEIEKLMSIKSNKKQVYTYKNIITSNGMTNSFLFGYEIIKYLKGDEFLKTFKKNIFEVNY